MALIQFSALVNSMSGKLNGSVMAFNKGGSYVRNKGIVANPNTTAQAAVRSVFGALSSIFKTLTPEQVAAWNSFAAANPYTNIFGESKTLTGLGLFVQRNINIQQGAGTTALEPLPNVATPVFSINEAAIVVEPGEPTIINLEVLLTPAEIVNWKPVLRITPSVPASKINTNNMLRKVPSVGFFGAGTDRRDVYALLSSVETVVGTLTPGEYIDAELYVVNRLTGQSSTSQKVRILYPL